MLQFYVEQKTTFMRKYTSETFYAFDGFDPSEHLKQQNIDSLCLVGGGAKGLTYTGSYEVLYDLDIVRGLKAVSGTSVGALTAFLIAIGTPSQDLYRQMSENSLPDLLGKGEKLYLGMQKDGKPLIEFLSSNIRKEFQKTFDENPNLDHLSDEERQIFDELKNNLETQVSYEPSMLDLAIMRKIHPDKYKDLIVATVHRKSEALHIFSSLDQTSEIRTWLSAVNSEKDGLIDLKQRAANRDYEFTAEDLKLIKSIDATKDFRLVKNREGKNEIFSQVSVIKACMASAALPLVLKNVTINGQKFTDGGLIKNMPFDVLPNQEGLLMLAFNNDAMRKAIHGRDEKPFEHDFLTWLLHYILRALGILIAKPFEESKNEELKDVRESAALKTAPNEVGGINVADFKAAQQQKDEMYLRGYIGTMNYLILYNKHPKAVEILRKEQELIEKAKGGEDTTALNAEIESLSKDFAKYRREFEMRKFCFELIDSKGLSRKTQKYKELLRFCMDKSNFENKDPKVVAKEFIQQMNGNERLLVTALNDKATPENILEAFRGAIDLNSKEKFSETWVKKVVESQGTTESKSPSRIE